AQVADEIRNNYAQCLTLAGTRMDLRLLRPPRSADHLRELGVVAQSVTELKAWIDQVEQIFEPRPSGLAPGLDRLVTDRRRSLLGQVGGSLTDDDAIGLFRRQSQLGAEVCALLSDIRDA